MVLFSVMNIRFCYLCMWIGGRWMLDMLKFVVFCIFGVLCSWFFSV